MVEPRRALRLLGYTALLLALALYILPPQVEIAQSVTFKSFTVRSLFEVQKADYADISDITTTFAESGKESSKDSVFIATSAKKAKKPTTSKPAEPKKTDSLSARYRIQYSEKADTALFALFRSLKELGYKDKLVRILHYGDSQLEGDRITAPLRQKLQNRFGGCGVGLIPLFDPIGGRNSIIVKSGYPWQKTFVYGNGYDKTNPNLYGLLGSYYTYTFQYRVERPDSLTTHGDSTAAQAAYAYKDWQRVSVSLAHSRRSGEREGRFEKIKLLYQNHDTPFELSIQTNTDTLVDRRTIQPDSLSVCRVYEQPFKGAFEQVKLTFGSSRSPAFFGVALDCNKGIAVDNISFRGSSGTDFTRMNRALLARQFKALDVKCIILQFGVNVVPYEAGNYSFYEQQFYNQLKLLRDLAPDVSILVVGVSDMSRKEGEFYVSYPNIEKIRDAQRRAAFRAGCAFWDLYEAMGGKNSMPSWVFAEQPLANKDFTHFTPKGARLVSEMLYKAILSEYEKFNSL